MYIITSHLHLLTTGTFKALTNCNSCALAPQIPPINYRIEISVTLHFTELKKPQKRKSNHSQLITLPHSR